ncbi:MAG: hypothetical protein ABIG61_06650 [Planctomycetota bacterium]
MREFVAICGKSAILLSGVFFEGNVMEDIVRQSRQSIHFAISFVVAAPWSMEKKKCVDLERVLLDERLEFSQTRTSQRDFTLIRTEQSNLQVQIVSLGPQVSRMSVIAEKPEDQLELFAKEAQTVWQSYRTVWFGGPVQILERRALIRQLYSLSDHAFKYLWEDRLGQSPEDFKLLGRPVLGGGLRFIMPPNPKDKQPVQIEVKIESFLQEAKRLFVETAFLWPKPAAISVEESSEVSNMLSAVENFATHQVLDFIGKVHKL